MRSGANSRIYVDAALRQAIEAQGPAKLMRLAMANGSSQRELAERLQLTPTHVSRVVGGFVGLGPQPCLRLADVLDEDPLVVLRECGHVRLADCVAALASGGPQRAQIHEAVDRLTSADRQIVSSLIDRLLAGATDCEPQAKEAKTVARCRPSRPPLRALSSLVACVEGSESQDIEPLKVVERAVGPLIGTGLLFSREEWGSALPVLRVIERLTETIHGTRESILRELETDATRGRQPAIAKVQALLRMQSEAAYYVGLTLGWRTAQRFGGAR